MRLWLVGESGPTVMTSPLWWIAIRRFPLVDCMRVSSLVKALLNSAATNVMSWKGMLLPTRRGVSIRAVRGLTTINPAAQKLPRASAGWWWNLRPPCPG